MENLGFYMMYVVEGIFVLLLLYAGIFWYPIAEFAMAVTKCDEAGMVMITCPVFAFIIAANILTEVKLRSRT